MKEFERHRLAYYYNKVFIDVWHNGLYAVLHILSL